MRFLWENLFRFQDVVINFSVDLLMPYFTSERANGRKCFVFEFVGSCLAPYRWRQLSACVALIDTGSDRWCPLRIRIDSRTRNARSFLLENINWSNVFIDAANSGRGGRERAKTNSLMTWNIWKRHKYEIYSEYCHNLFFPIKFIALRTVLDGSVEHLSSPLIRGCAFVRLSTTNRAHNTIKQ